MDIIGLVAFAALLIGFLSLLERHDRRLGLSHSPLDPAIDPLFDRDAGRVRLEISANHDHHPQAA